jgi:hypothetical protein
MLRYDLVLLVKCFPRVERIVCDIQTRVLEREWIDAAAGKLKHLVSVRGPEPVLGGSDAWMTTLCASALLPRLAELSLPRLATRACVAAVCQQLVTDSMRPLFFMATVC